MSNWKRRVGWVLTILVAMFLVMGSVMKLLALPAVLTGYLGGAAATHVRAGNPLFSHVLFGVYVGTLVWLGLCLRDPAVQKVFPYRKS